MKAAEMARNNTTVCAIVAMFCLGSLFMIANPFNLGGGQDVRHRASVTHIVLFQFKATAAADAVAQANRQMLALKDTCLDPNTKKPYIRSVTGGRDNSIEDLQSGISYAYVVEFDSLEMRDYYVNVDPAHRLFKEAAGPLFEKVIVVDFSNGAF